MTCASCDRPMPDGAVICRLCNTPDPEPDETRREPLSHHDLAQTVRRLKGLVVVSLAFGFIVAPVALYVATAALRRYGPASSTDPAILRQIVLLRRLSAGLLVLWAFVIGGWLRSFLSAGPAA